MLRVRGIHAVCWLAANFALSGARVARAGDAPSPIRITYRAPADCPTEAAFSSQVVQRTALVRLANADETNARPVQITLSATPQGYSGRLEVSGSDGQVLNRDVDGDTCAEVVSALALVTALALDPQASLQPIAPAAEAATAAPAPSSPASVAHTQPQPQAVPARAATTLPPEPRDASSAEPAPLHIAIGGDLAGRAGATPDRVLVLAVFIELELTSLRPFSPVLRASFERSQSDEIETEPGQAAFRWTAGSLEACPIQWSQSAFRASPCVRIEAGVLEAEGRAIVPAHGHSRPWLAFGTVGRAEWSFLDPAFADLGAGIVFPAIRDRFFFQPDTTVHRTAAAGWLVRGGLGVRFP